MKLLLLRLSLVARCVISVALAWHFATTKPSTPPEIARAFAPFTFIDGILALVVAGLVLSEGWRKGLAVIAVLGAFVRITAALAIWYGPGIPYFAVTFVLYVGLLATLGLLIGLVELGEAVRLWSDIQWRPLSLLLALEGAATLVLAIVALFATPDPLMISRLLVAGAVLEAFALLAVALKGPRPEVASH
jgi:hypothetical protein